jgi:quinol monooxygenase YgiN
MQTLHFIVNFEPLPGKEAEFKEHLYLIQNRTRTEPGCLQMNIFQTVAEPARFAIHSVWMDEAAFERHTTLAHTTEFVAAVEPLLTRSIEGLQLHAI